MPNRAKLTMVERVARALLAARGAQMPLCEDWWQLQMRHYREMTAQFPGYASGGSMVADAMRDARAVITAMREPTPVMRAAAQGIEGDRGRYQAMIDAALAEDPLPSTKGIAAA